MQLRIVATLAGFVSFAGRALSLFDDVETVGPDMDRPVNVALGPAAENKVEMELPVTDVMMMHEPPGIGSPYRNAHEWSRAHLQVVDANGTELNWRRRGHPTYMQGASAGISDGFLMFSLQPGATYTLTYTPSVAEGISYSTEFVAPNASSTSERQLIAATRI